MDSIQLGKEMVMDPQSPVQTKDDLFQKLDLFDQINTIMYSPFHDGKVWLALKYSNGDGCGDIMLSEDEFNKLRDQIGERVLFVEK